MQHRPKVENVEMIQIFADMLFFVIVRKFEPAYYFGRIYITHILGMVGTRLRQKITCGDGVNKN